MGCDIHPYVEVRQQEGWQKVHDIFENAYFREDDPLDDWNRPTSDRPYFGRNYTLFAILAGVRNYHEVSPIAQPRGVPPDVSSGILGEYTLRILEPGDDPELPGMCSMEDAVRLVANKSSSWVREGEIITHPDWHSASWFTLAELLAVDWHGRKVTLSGRVDAQRYQEFRQQGKPSQFAGFTSSRKVSPRTLEKRIAAGTAAGYHTEVSWEESWAEVSGWFHARTLPALAGLIRAEGPLAAQFDVFFASWCEGDRAVVPIFSDWLADHALPSFADVRLVFWFDN